MKLSSFKKGDIITRTTPHNLIDTLIEKQGPSVVASQTLVPMIEKHFEYSQEFYGKPITFLGIKNSIFFYKHVYDDDEFSSVQTTILNDINDDNWIFFPYNEYLEIVKENDKQESE